MQRPSLKTFADGQARCGWLIEDPLYIAYHDQEWGAPHEEERALFELLCLEGQQAGLSWLTVLRKRQNYRKAFARFDARKVARFGARDIARLLKDAGIIRHRGKIEAIIGNARALVALHKEGGSLQAMALQALGGKRLQRRPRSLKDIPASTDVSKALSKALLAKGFRFVGPTTCYAFLQATGFVDDHVQGCIRAGK